MEIIKKLKEKLEKSNAHFKSEIVTLSVGRANPLLLDGIMVDYYGTPTPLKQVASISIPDPRTLVVQPWDKGQLKEIEKAINLSKLGLNPVNDGEKIRLNVPQPTEERRKELAKHLNGFVEKAKIAGRTEREDAMREIKKMEKDGDISEDERFRKQEEIQKIIDGYNGNIDAEGGKKEKEIMTI